MGKDKIKLISAKDELNKISLNMKRMEAELDASD
jgi:hypothetical protein